MSNELAPLPAEPEPAPVKPKAPEKRPARIDRFTIGFSVAVQVFVALAIVLMLNYLSFRQFKRWDFSRNQKFSLSPLTKNVLSNLDDRVQAIVFFPQAQMLAEDVSALLREYEFASNRKLVVEYVNPYRNLNRARELAEKYKFGASDNIVILDYKGKSKFVNAQDMADMDVSGQMMGQPPTVKTFKGEEVITSSLMELTEEKQNKLYLLGGHGEPDINGQELTGLKAYAERQNVKFGTVNLNNVDAMPADATGVMIVGPKTDLSDREIKLLSDYWTEKKGRLVILLNPMSKTPRLDDWLASEGVVPQHDRVLKTGTVLQMNDANQPVLRNGIITRASAVFSAGGKSVTKDIAGIDIQLFGATESLKLDDAKAGPKGNKLITLVESSEGFWGETEPINEGRQVFFDSTKDHAHPLVIAAAVEKGGLADQRVKVETARMIVSGNSGFVLDDGLRMSDIGIDFALNGLNWIFNREQMAGIAPKPKAPLRISVDEERMNALALTVIVLIPGLVGLIGVAVWLQRRS
jgi:hypothetical protein